MESEYHNPNPAKTPEVRRYRGSSYSRPIDAAKEAVSVLELAERLAGPGKMRRSGKSWTINCLLPDHEDRTPSFTVNPEKNLWFCHGCLHGGDVVELGRLAWGYDERDAHVAAADLLHEFGFEIPSRPPAWWRKRERQAPIRDAMEGMRIKSTRRRLMRVCSPLLEDIEDPEERHAETRKLWEDLEPVARMAVRRAGR